MNYFELYGLPVTIAPDLDVVKKTYYALSKEYHPDFYITESEEKQAEILQLSTMNTNAFDTFKSERKLIPYVLKMYDAYEEGNNEKLPQDFLMEMMDMNEQLMELEFDVDTAVLEKVQKELDGHQEDIAKGLEGFPRDLGGLCEEERVGFLEKLKDYYLKRKYLLRIQERLDKFAAR